MPDRCEPPGEGWYPWLHPLMPGGTGAEGALAAGGCVELWRSEWGNETVFAKDGSIPPEMNVAGLWWRPA